MNERERKILMKVYGHAVPLKLWSIWIYLNAITILHHSLITFSEVISLIADVYHQSSELQTLLPYPPLNPSGIK